MILLGSRGKSAARWAEFARAAVAGMVQDPAMEGTRVTVSIGVAEAVPGETASQAMVRADAALYEAKRGGRDAVVVAGGPGYRAWRPGW